MHFSSLVGTGNSLQKSRFGSLLLMISLLISSLSPASSPKDPDWLVEQVRLLDPVDSTSSSLDIIAAYARLTEYDLEIRLDLLQVQDPWAFDIQLKIDMDSGGLSDLTNDDASDMDWDWLISAPAELPPRSLIIFPVLNTTLPCGLAGIVAINKGPREQVDVDLAAPHAGRAPAVCGADLAAGVPVHVDLAAAHLGAHPVRHVAVDCDDAALHPRAQVHTGVAVDGEGAGAHLPADPLDLGEVAVQLDGISAVSLHAEEIADPRRPLAGEHRQIEDLGVAEGPEDVRGEDLGLDRRGQLRRQGELHRAAARGLCPGLGPEVGHGATLGAESARPRQARLDPGEDARDDLLVGRVRTLERRPDLEGQFIHPVHGAGRGDARGGGRDVHLGQPARVRDVRVDGDRRHRRHGVDGRSGHGGSGIRGEDEHRVDLAAREQVDARELAGVVAWVPAAEVDAERVAREPARDRVGAGHVAVSAQRHGDETRVVVELHPEREDRERVVVLAAGHGETHAEEHGSVARRLHALSQVSELLERESCLGETLGVHLVALDQCDQGGEGVEVPAGPDLQEEVGRLGARRGPDVDTDQRPALATLRHVLPLGHGRVTGDVARVALHGVGAPVDDEVGPVLDLAERRLRPASQLGG